ADAQPRQGRLDAVDDGGLLANEGLALAVWTLGILLRELETKLQQIDTQRLPPPSEEERAQLLALGSDLERAWNHPAATAETRKRILRTVITEIVARLEGNQVHLVLHWQGGDHSELKVAKPRNGEHRWTLDATTTDIIRELARLMPDMSIAAL